MEPSWLGPFPGLQEMRPRRSDARDTVLAVTRTVAPSNNFSHLNDPIYKINASQGKINPTVIQTALKKKKKKTSHQTKVMEVILMGRRSLRQPLSSGVLHRLSVFASTFRIPLDPFQLMDPRIRILIPKIRIFILQRQTSG